MMSHTNHITDNLSAYLDGQLSTSEQNTVEAHVLTCAACHADLEALRYTRQMLHQLPALRAQRSFTLSPEQAAQLRPWWQKEWLPSILRGLTTISAALFLLVLGADFLLLSSAANRAAFETASVPPQAPMSAQSQSAITDQSKPAGTAVAILPASGTSVAPSAPVAPPVAQSGAAERPTADPSAFKSATAPAPLPTLAAPLPPSAAGAAQAMPTPAPAPALRATPAVPTNQSAAPLPQATSNATTTTTKSGDTPLPTSSPTSARLIATPTPNIIASSGATSNAMPLPGQPADVNAAPTAISGINMTGSSSPSTLPATDSLPRAASSETWLDAPLRLLEVILLGLTMLGLVGIVILKILKN